MLDVQDNNNCSVHELITKLCRCFIKNATKKHIKRIHAKRFEELLRFSKTAQLQNTLTSNTLLSKLDMFYTELYFMHNSRDYDRASELHCLLQKLKNEDGEIIAEIQQCLHFFLCLARWSSKPQKYLGGDWILPTLNDTNILYDVSKYPSVYGDSRLYKPSFYYMEYPKEIFETSTELPLVEYKNLRNQIFETTPGLDECGNSLYSFHSAKPGNLSDIPNSSYMFGSCHQSQSSNNFILQLPVLTAHQAHSPMLFTLSTSRSPSPIESLDNAPDEGFIEVEKKNNPTVFPADPSEIWETVARTPHKQRRSWDKKNKLTGTQSPHYLCQSGPMAGQAAYRSHLQHLQMLDPRVGEHTSSPHTFDQLIQDVINLLLGVPSKTFMYNKQTHLFRLKGSFSLPGLTSEPLNQILNDFLECGSLYLKLEYFSDPEALGSYLNNGLVVERLKEGVSQYLQHYRGCILYAKENHSNTLLTLHQGIHKSYRQLRYLTDLCLGDRQILSRVGHQSTLPKGLKLLTSLYQNAVHEWGGENDLLLVFLLKTACIPYLKFLHDWVFEGTLNDPYSEFNIQINEHCLTNQGEKNLFWSHGYVLKENKNYIPFLGENMTHTVLLCGKSLNLLKICDPKHSLLDSRHPRPELCLSLTNSGLQKSAEESQNYYDSLHTILFTPEEVELEVNAVIQKEVNAEVPQKVVDKVNKLKMKNVAETIAETQSISKIETVDVVSKELIDPFAEIIEKVKLDLTEHYEQEIKKVEFAEQKLLWQAKRLELHEKRYELIESDPNNLNAPGAILKMSACETESDLTADLGTSKCNNENTDQEVSNQIEEANTDQEVIESNTDQEVIEPNTDQEVKTSVEEPSTNQEVKTAVEESNTDQEVETSVEKLKIVPAALLTLKDKCLPTNEIEEVLECLETQILEKEAIHFSEVTINPFSFEQGGVLNLKAEHQIHEIITTNSEKPGSLILGLSEKPELPKQLAEVSVTGKENECSTRRPHARPYQTDYPTFSALPNKDFLGCLNVFGPTQNWDKDQEADCLSMPLAVFFQRSLDLPLIAQARLVNQAVLCHFKKNLQLGEHFTALRNLFFFNDGEFGRVLSNLIYKKSSLSHFRDLLNPFVLCSILNNALSTCYSSESPLAENFSLGLKLGCNTQPSPGFAILANLELRYKVDWPLDIVISEDSEELYNRIFAFLLQVKQVIWTLIDTWYHLKQCDQMYHISNHWQFRQIQIFRHEMLHFAQTVHEFVSSQVLQTSWQEFQTELEEVVEDLDQLCAAHMKYLHKACTRCMLGSNSDVSLQRSMEMAFQLSMHFHTQLLSMPWQQGMPLGDVAFERLAKTYRHFKNQTVTLYKDWLQTSQP